LTLRNYKPPPTMHTYMTTLHFAETYTLYKNLDDREYYKLLSLEENSEF